MANFLILYAAISLLWSRVATAYVKNFPRRVGMTVNSRLGIQARVKVTMRPFRDGIGCQPLALLPTATAATI